MTTKAPAKVRKVMHEFKEGVLFSASAGVDLARYEFRLGMRGATTRTQKTAHRARKNAKSR